MASTSQWFITQAPALVTTAARWLTPTQCFLNTHGTSEASRQVPCGTAGTFLKMKVALSGDPGVGTYQFQISINGTPDTTMQLTLGAGQTTGEATGSVAIAQGSLWSIKYTPSGSPTAVDVQISIEFLPTSDNYYQYYHNFLNSNSSINNYSAMAPSTLAVGADGLGTRQCVFPLAGTLRSIHYLLSVAPGVGTTRSVQLARAGSDIGSIATISGASAVYAAATGLSTAISAGDKLDLHHTSSGAPASAVAATCVVIESTTAGEFALINNNDNNLDAYGAASGQRSAAWSATEGPVQLRAPTVLVCTAITLGMNTGPGVGSTRTATFRKSGADGSNTCSISGNTANQTVVDSAHTTSVNTGDLINIGITGSGGLGSNVTACLAVKVDTGAATVYTQFGEVIREINPADWGPSRTVYFEAMIRKGGSGTVHARLYNATTNALVASSDVTSTSSTPDRVRSGAITLASGDNEYYAEFGGPEGGGPYFCYAADVIVDAAP